MPRLSRVIPHEYQELFNKITDPWTFAQDNWYRMPEDSFKTQFLNWYYRSYGCIEYSENNTHFRVTFWPIIRTPGVSLSDKDFEEINARESGAVVAAEKPNKVEEKTNVFEDL